MKAKTYNLENSAVGEIDLPEDVFGERWRPALVHQVFLAQLANLRRPWAHAKTRSEVRGGGRKPWRQKGTGRARHGSIRSPLWAGGGKAHGPLKERVYSQAVTKKMKRTALASVLSKKFKDGNVKIFEDFSLASPKTKLIAEKLARVLGARKREKFDVLFIPRVGEKPLYRAAANLTKVKILDPRSLNVGDLLNHKHLFIDREAVGAIRNHFYSKT